MEQEKDYAWLDMSLSNMFFCPVPPSDGSLVANDNSEVVPSDSVSTIPLFILRYYNNRLFEWVIE